MLFCCLMSTSMLQTQPLSAECPVENQPFCISDGWVQISLSIDGDMGIVEFLNCNGSRLKMVELAFNAFFCSQQLKMISHNSDPASSILSCSSAVRAESKVLLKSALISEGLASNCSTKSLIRYPLRAIVGSKSSICRDSTDSTTSVSHRPDKRLQASILGIAELVKAFIAQTIPYQKITK